MSIREKLLRRTPQQQRSPYDLRLQYILHASYWFYRAVGPDEQMASALNRMMADREKREMEARCIPVPTPEEVQAYAKTKWPGYQLKELEPGKSLQ